MYSKSASLWNSFLTSPRILPNIFLQEAFSQFIKVNSIILMSLLFCSTLLPSPQNWEFICIYKPIPNSLTQRFIFHLQSLKVLYDCIESISHFRGCPLNGSLVAQLVKNPTAMQETGLIPGLGRSTDEGIDYPLQYSWASLILQMVKNLPSMKETWVQSLGWEDPLEKGTATHSSILTWRIPWTEEPGML